ncbi:unnamed protein product [Closterium sp. Naga37s-1]|nr:unnamed protein product [Closterium sp. Naga37s-1]
MHPHLRCNLTQSPTQPCFLRPFLAPALLCAAPPPSCATIVCPTNSTCNATANPPCICNAGFEMTNGQCVGEFPPSHPLSHLLFLLSSFSHFSFSPSSFPPSCLSLLHISVNLTLLPLTLVAYPCPSLMSLTHLPLTLASYPLTSPPCFSPSCLSRLLSSHLAHLLPAVCCAPTLLCHHSSSSSSSPFCPSFSPSSRALPFHRLPSLRRPSLLFPSLPLLSLPLSPCLLPSCRLPSLHLPSHLAFILIASLPFPSPPLPSLPLRSSPLSLSFLLLALFLLSLIFPSCFSHSIVLPPPFSLWLLSLFPLAIFIHCLHLLTP